MNIFHRFFNLLLDGADGRGLRATFAFHLFGIAVIALVVLMVSSIGGKESGTTAIPYLAGLYVLPLIVLSSWRKYKAKERGS